MSLESAFSRIHRWQRLSRCLEALVLGTAALVTISLISGLLDAWQAFESPSRTTLVTIAGTLSILTLLSLLTIALRWSKQRSALSADSLLHSPRNPTSAALTLPSESTTSLHEYLANHSRTQTAAQLNAIPARHLIAWSRLLRHSAILCATLMPAVWISLSFPDACSTIVQRLLQPKTDLPPWSPLQFIIEPESPAAIYGSELPLTVTISGAPIRDTSIELLVRDHDKGTIQSLSCYRESDQRFSRTLDTVIEPVSIAFACGKARSPWHPVELLLQPRVLSGTTTISPPAYTAIEPLHSTLDSDQIKAVAGSKVRLTLTSNRPLSNSPASFLPDPKQPGEETSPHLINGTVENSDSIRFEWTATESGTLRILLQDIRGTAAAIPMELKFRIIPDMAPVIDLSSPPRVLMATPSSSLRIKATAEDEFGLASMRLVKALKGFRDRSTDIATKLTQKDFEFTNQLALSNIGVKPGETIELFVEATDHNPTLLGQGSSEISEIHIISEEDYAAHIRARTTLDEFNARYRAIQEALEAARKSLDQVQKALDSKDAHAIQKTSEQAAKAHGEATRLLEQLANDFPAFATEKRLADIARQSANDLQPNIEALRNLPKAGNAAQQQAALDAMKQRMGAQRKQQEQLEQDAELMAQAGAVLSMASKLKQIYQTQQSLAQRIKTIAVEIYKGKKDNARLLKSLADTQEKNREALDKFANDLREILKQITRPELDEMKQSATAFLEALRLSDPQSVMTLGTEAGRNGKANDAYVQAELARALLEKLMEEPAPFPQACKGDCMDFKIPRPDVNQAMQQLLEGLMCQNPGYNPSDGQGGGGMGTGGTGPTGNAMPGYSASDVPILGPQRMQFDPASMSDQGNGQGDQKATGGTLPEVAEKEHWKPEDEQNQTRQAPDPQSVPEAYRDAVKSYFINDNP